MAELTSAHLDLHTVASQFIPPADTSFTRSAFEFLQGEKLLGIYTRERVLEPGVSLTALGVLQPIDPSSSSASASGKDGSWLASWTDPAVAYQILPPEMDTSSATPTYYPYLLTRRTFTQLLQDQRRTLVLWKWILLGSLGILSWVLGRRLYRRLRMAWDRREARRYLRALRARIGGIVSPPDEDDLEAERRTEEELEIPTSPNNGNNSSTCLICLQNPRETVLIPCGHLVACSACLYLHPPSSTTSSHANRSELRFERCPVCRAWITEALRVYQ